MHHEGTPIKLDKNNYDIARQARFIGLIHHPCHIAQTNLSTNEVTSVVSACSGRAATTRGLLEQARQSGLRSYSKLYEYTPSTSLKTM